MMRFYALVNEKKQTAFLITAITDSELDMKIQRAYWSARGMAPKGSNYELPDFLNGKKKVIVTIEDINHD